MLGVYSVQQRKVIATWNSTRDVWETGQDTIFGPSAVYSETWPTSGMTRNGTAYELPTSEHHTTGSGSSSLLPTPVADNYKESGNCRDFGGDLTHALTCDCKENQKLLPTPTTIDAAVNDTLNQMKTGDSPGFQSIAGLLNRSEEHTSELQSRGHLVCRLLLE